MPTLRRKIFPKLLIGKRSLHAYEFEMPNPDVRSNGLIGCERSIILKQELFEMTTRDGAVVALVRLESLQCAIVRDGEIVNTYAADDAGVSRALKRYFQTVDECGGSPHPFQAMDGLCGHPHAG